MTELCSRIPKRKSSQAPHSRTLGPIFGGEKGDSDWREKMHDCNLKIRNIIVLAIALTPLRPLHGQDDCGDECRVNSNLPWWSTFPSTQPRRSSAPAGVW